VAGRLWRGVADCLYRLRRADKLQGQTDYVIVKDLFQPENQSAAELKPLRYRQLETEPNMVLKIGTGWTTFDDYLGSLTSRYRAAAKKVMKPFDGSELTVHPIAAVAAESDRIFELDKAVAARAEVRMFELKQSTLPRLASALQDDFAAIGVRKNGILIGFVTVVKDGSTAIGYYLGMDYQLSDQFPLYHRLLFAVFGQAIQWKCQQVSFGRTALHAKSELGCKPEPAFVWIRHRVPLLNIVVQQLLKSVTHAEPPDRSPFKDADKPEARIRRLRKAMHNGPSVLL